MQEGEELEHPWLNRSIESAQKKVEQQNYAQRKRLLQYDDVLNQQREVIYGIRNGAIHADRPKDIIFEQIEEELSRTASKPPASARRSARPRPRSRASSAGSTPISRSAAKLDELKGDARGPRAKLLGASRKAYAVKESVEIPRRSARSSGTW
jgi:preprotein translocase subunit SecA